MKFDQCELVELVVQKRGNPSDQLTYTALKLISDSTYQINNFYVNNLSAPQKIKTRCFIFFSSHDEFLMLPPWGGVPRDDVHATTTNIGRN